MSNNAADTLLDAAYLVARGWSRTHPAYDYALPKLEQACPGFTATQYRDACEKALSLVTLAMDLAGKWVDHQVADLEGLDRLKEQCPGFSDVTYSMAWHGSCLLASR